MNLGLIHVRIRDNLEDRLREHIHRRGDLTRVIEEAIELWLKKKVEE